ncbi:nuclease harbi1-like protein [Plakobranchus ocellatus]|uniref:Nuclease harbi1-like protein n=1 Tax=Plakobranchus ocellatus TaxID=259542 RepID=A0AAV3XUT4_9GAST|nr:nuclease harbi1-like protein [Plakobranchus ocellatus]
MSRETFNTILDYIMGFPDTAPLPDSSARIPYFMMEDVAYPLKPYLITTFCGALTQQQIYNKCHSKARICIECAFGVLAARWRELKTGIATGFETTENIVLAVLVLDLQCITKRH